MTKTIAFVLSAALAGACAGGQAEVRYSGSAATPELVAMETNPSVMIVANADEPVFFVENTYWLYRDKQWYRSSSHKSGWKAGDPPEHVRRIERPEAFVHVQRNAPQTTFNQRDPGAPAERSEYPADSTTAPGMAPDPAGADQQPQPAIPDSKPQPMQPDGTGNIPPQPGQTRQKPPLPDPMTEPNSQGPGQQPYPGQMPPNNQVPPVKPTPERP